MRHIIFMAGVVLAAGPAIAQQAPMAGMSMPMQMPMKPAATCPATPAPLPPELAGWAAKTPVTAGGTLAAAAPLTIGQGASATLLPTPQVIYPIRPEHPGGSVSSGGLFSFTVATAGRYRIALGSAAWIDVVRDGAALVSVAHGHGPDCSGIGKMVDFDLMPGAYTLQIASSGSPALALMVAKLPA